MPELEQPAPAPITADHGFDAAPRRRTGWRLPGTLAVVAALAALGIALASSGGVGPVASAAAATAVQRAAVSTLQGRSEDVTLNGSVAVLGHHIAIVGEGACALATFECRMTVTIPGLQGTLEELVLPTGLYLKLPSGATSSGRPWVFESLALAKLRKAAGTSGTSPLEGISALTRSGATVTSLGSTTFNGRSATKYSVHYSASAVRARLAKVSAVLTPAQRQVVEHDAAAFGGVDEVVYLEGGHVIGLTVSESATEHGIPYSVSVTESMRASSARVVVVPPPASQVAPFSSLGSVGAIL